MVVKKLNAAPHSIATLPSTKGSPPRACRSWAEGSTWALWRRSISHCRASSAAGWSKVVREGKSRESVIAPPFCHTAEGMS